MMTSCTNHTPPQQQQPSEHNEEEKEGDSNPTQCAEEEQGDYNPTQHDEEKEECNNTREEEEGRYDPTVVDNEPRSLLTTVAGGNRGNNWTREQTHMVLLPPFLHNLLYLGPRTHTIHVGS